MSIPPFSPIPFPSSPLTHITPFTYRDGATFLQILEAFREWLNDQIVPGINDLVAQLILNYQTALDDLITQGDAKIAELDALYNAFVAEITELVTAINKPDANNHRKTIKHNLPYQFPGWDEGALIWGREIVPQGFAVDTVANELFIVYCDVSTVQVFAVWDWTTGAFKRCFSTPSAQTSEGLELIWEGGRRYMYNRHTLTGLGKFDVTELPANFSSILPEETIDLGMGRTFSKINGGWLTTVGARRDLFYRFDDDFNRIGTMLLPTGLVGETFGSTENTKNLPKMQGFCEYDGNIAVGMGGHFNYTTSEETPYTYQGLRVFSGNGNQLFNALYSPVAMRDLLAPHLEFLPRVMENEGSKYVGNRLYTFYFTHAGNEYEAEIASVEGILILEEFATVTDAIDFGPAAVWSGIPDFRIIPELPVISSQILNPITAQPFTTIVDLITYMLEVGQDVVSWYTTNVNITLPNTDTSTPGTPAPALPVGKYVRLVRGSTTNFALHIDGAAYGYRFSRNDTSSPWVSFWMSGDTARDLVFVAGASAYSASYRRVGDETVLDGGVNLTGIPASTWTKVSSVPAGFRPTRMMYYPNDIVGSATTGDLRVQPNGDIEVNITATTPATMTLTGVRFRSETTLA